MAGFPDFDNYFKSVSQTGKDRLELQDDITFALTTLEIDGALTAGQPIQVTSLLTIASDTITLPEANAGVLLLYATIDTEGAAATDTLATITPTGTLTTGTLLLLKTATSSRDVTLTHDGAKIALRDAANATLGTSADFFLLVWRGTAWVELGRNLNAQSLTATATLNFGSITAQTCAELTITVTGAVANDAIAIGLPAAFTANLSATGYVSATDTVTVRVCNPTSGAIDPASGTFRATCVRQ